MEKHIDSMEPGSPHSVEETVPAEREDGQGTIGFVRFCIREGKPPEVVAEDLR